MVFTKLTITTGIRFSKLQSVISPVACGEFLLNDVCLDSATDVASLCRQIGSQMVVGVAHLESRISEVAPKYGRHPQFMGISKSLRYLCNLTVRLFRTKIDGCPYCGSSHLIGLIHGTEKNLFVLVWIA